MLTIETLTLEQARTVLAVPETALLVGQAAGFDVRLGHDGRMVMRGEEPRVTCNRILVGEWRPDTDANAAIEAAEAVLWGSVPPCFIKPLIKPYADGVYEIAAVRAPPATQPIERIASATTFPLAICRAILVRSVLERSKP